jgi:hypothetical protein
VDVLRATKDFKRGIYLLQWENRHKEMEVRPGRLPSCIGCLIMARGEALDCWSVAGYVKLQRCPLAQAEDVAAQTRELQLLHVTKEFQQLIKGGPGGGGSGGSSGSGRHAEAASLEGLLRSREQLHVRKVAGYKRLLQRIQQEVDLKQAQSDQVRALVDPDCACSCLWFSSTCCWAVPAGLDLLAATEAEAGAAASWA